MSSARNGLNCNYESHSTQLLLAGWKRQLRVHVAPQLGIETLIISIPKSSGNSCTNSKRKLQWKEGWLQANKYSPAIY